MKVQTRAVVTLKASLADDRYPAGREIRAGQIGVVQGHHGEDWWWVQWYLPLIEHEAAQCVREHEIEVIGVLLR